MRLAAELLKEIALLTSLMKSGGIKRRIAHLEAKTERLLRMS